MTRFFAFGCSYTLYSWPTWADIIGLSQDNYENWAIPGLGNRAIFERLTECHTKNQFGKDDLVIVQWSSHLRFDWFNRHSLKDRTHSWRTGGSIFSLQNEDIFDKHWQHLFFDEFAYLMHTLNYIVAAQNLLENSGCRWFMTSIGDIRKLGFDLLNESDYGEKVSSKDQNWSKYPELEFYENIIWRKNADHWISPMQPYCRSMNDEFYTFFDYIRKKSLIDFHPTPHMFSKWVDHHLGDQINIDIEGTKEILNSVEKLYQEIGKNKIRHEFDNQLQDGNFVKPKNMSWPNVYKGIN